MRGPRSPVILVQGLACSREALGPLERRIGTRLGRPALRPCRGLGFRDLRDTAFGLYEALERAPSTSPFERMDIVAHSMGGLVAAYLLKCLDQGRRVRRVVALGTPFAGVAGGSLGRLFGPFGTPLRQVARNSSLLRLLHELPVPSGSALISIRGQSDRIVPPEASGPPGIPGHHGIDVPGCDHARLLLGARAFEAIARALSLGPREIGGVPQSGHRVAA